MFYYIVSNLYSFAMLNVWTFLCTFSSVKLDDFEPWTKPWVKGGQKCSLLTLSLEFSWDFLFLIDILDNNDLVIRIKDFSSYIFWFRYDFLELKKLGNWDLVVWEKDDFGNVCYYVFKVRYIDNDYQKHIEELIVEFFDLLCLHSVKALHILNL